MAVEKLSISVPIELADQVRELAEDNDETISAFLVEAARARVRNLLLDRFLADVAAEEGWDLDAMAADGARILDEALAESASAPPAVATGHAA